MNDQPTNTPRPSGLDDLLAYVAENLPQNDPDRCAETLAAMPVAGSSPAPMDPEVVNAIVRDMDDPRFPSRITVFCDHCGAANTGEYMVREGMTSTERLAVARAHLVKNEGWEHDPDDGDDFCPTHAGSKPSVPDRPYTEDDLRAEAARQHATLTEDPDFVGVGEAMEDRYVQSTAPEPEGLELTGSTWAELLDPESDGTDVYNEAQRKAHDLINGAADVSQWAVGIGADGLEPDEHQFTLKAGETPFIRVHSAFAPGLSDEGRDAFVEGLGAAAAREMSLALEENPEPTIGSEAAAHVLFQERLGGWPPSTFAAKLLDVWTSADTNNAERLADGFPEYAAAIALLKSGQAGIDQLRAIADGT